MNARCQRSHAIIMENQAWDIFLRVSLLLWSCLKRKTSERELTVVSNLRRKGMDEKIRHSKRP